MGHRRPGKHQAVIQQTLTSRHVFLGDGLLLLPSSEPIATACSVANIQTLLQFLDHFPCPSRNAVSFWLLEIQARELLQAWEGNRPPVFFSLWSYTLNSTGSHSSETRRQLQNIRASLTNTTPPISKSCLLSSVSPTSCVPMSAWKYQSSH